MPWLHWPFLMNPEKVRRLTLESSEEYKSSWMMESWETCVGGSCMGRSSVSSHAVVVHEIHTYKHTPASTTRMDELMHLSGWKPLALDKVVIFLAPFGICLKIWDCLPLDFTRALKAGRENCDHWLHTVCHGGANAKLVGDQKVQEMPCDSHHSGALEFCSWPYRLR